MAPREAPVQELPVAQTASPTKATMSINEAARYLGVGRSTPYELVRTGQLQSIRVGRQILIPVRALDAYIDS
jgi:excisionase family DNA binding protein